MSVTFDASATVAAYSAAFRQLQKLPGFSLPQLLRAEAGVILKTWAGRVKVAPAVEVDDRSRYLALKRVRATQGGSVGDVTINVGLRGPAGLVWLHTGGRRSGNRWGRTTAARPFSLVGRMQQDGRFVAQWRHYSPRQWRDVMETVADAEIAIRKELEAGRQSIGLARQSVIQIADDLGIDLNSVKGGGHLSAAGIDKARRTVTRKGMSFKNGIGTQGGTEDRCFVDLLNQLPYGRKIGLDRVLLGVLKGRAKYLATSIEKGALESMARVQRAFPEVFRQRIAA